MPKSKKDYWKKKLEGNVVRFKDAARMLRKDGWRVTVVWECQAKQPERLQKRIAKAAAGK